MYYNRVLPRRYVYDYRTNRYTPIGFFLPFALGFATAPLVLKPRPYYPYNPYYQQYNPYYNKNYYNPYY